MLELGVDNLHLQAVLLLAKQPMQVVASDASTDVQLGRLRLDIPGRLAFVDQCELSLAPVEFDLLPSAPFSAPAAGSLAACSATQVCQGHGFLRL